jgi:hypothetical protein
MTRRKHTPLTISDSDQEPRTICAADGEPWPCDVARKRGEVAWHDVETDDEDGEP